MGASFDVKRANTEAAGSVTMMSERERVMVLMSTIHSGYRLLKRRIDLGELPAVNTLVVNNSDHLNYIFSGREKNSFLSH